MARLRIGPVVMLALLSAACGGSGNPFPGDPAATSEPGIAEDEPGPAPEGSDAWLGPITFAADVTEEGDAALPPGEYGLDLFVAGEWIRGGAFTVTAEPIPEGGVPGTREELVDPGLYPAFDLLAGSPNDLLRELADYALNHGIEIVLSDEINSFGVYRCSPENRIPGTVFVQRDYYHEVTWEEVAATIAHELTHAVQHIGRGACGCTIENEYYAFLSQLYVLQETGRMDLLAGKWDGVYDDATGEFDSWALWEALEEEYSDCPEYWEPGTRRDRAHLDVPAREEGRPGRFGRSG